MPFVLALADHGWQRALESDPHLRNGLNVCKGHVTCKPVADALGQPYVDPMTLLH
jgi:alanine dehydrogenase